MERAALFDYCSLGVAMKWINGLHKVIMFPKKVNKCSAGGARSGALNRRTRYSAKELVVVFRC